MSVPLFARIVPALSLLAISTDALGDLFGATAGGGSATQGIVYELKPPAN